MYIHDIYIYDIYIHTAPKTNTCHEKAVVGEDYFPFGNGPFLGDNSCSFFGVCIYIYIMDIVYR